MLMPCDSSQKKERKEGRKKEKEREGGRKERTKQASKKERSIVSEYCHTSIWDLCSVVP